MPEKSSSGSDFASVLSRATAVPEAAGEGRDLPDGFPFPSMAGHRIVDSTEEEAGGGIEGLVAYDWYIQRKVFVIYRPWDNCGRCEEALARGTDVLPAEGDYECPHTQVKEYKTVLDDILAAKFVFGSEQEIPQKDGSIVISLRWYEKKSKRKLPKVTVAVKTAG